MFAVIVTFEIREGQMEAFMPLMLANAATSLEDEAGCHQFDVCRDPERPDEVFLYEIYEDAQAFQIHLKSAHFLAFDTKVADMIASKSVKTYGEVTQ